MAIDPRKLGPTALCRLLNSTPLGEVLSERQLHRHRNRAGFRVGEGRHVDLIRYVAWLVGLRHAEEAGLTGYEAKKEQVHARDALLSLSGRDIGELPAVVDPERKAKAASDFRFFCEVYFPLTFYLAWSPDHLKVIAKIEKAVLQGGLFAMAMPRGSGKTAICECACIWAVLYGHREFVCLIGSDEGHAAEMLDSIKTEFDGNDLLLADFPEVVYPIQRLEGIANRCAGQLYQGERTHIGWTAKEIVLPTMPDSPASAAIIKVAGITGGIRGMKFKRRDGKSVRPSLVILDDPQTDESARSLSQCATREGILAGAILGLAGPAKKISGIMPCTVIQPGDMADNILDQTKHPEWNGERTRMVYSFPTDEKSWARYGELRAESLRQYGDIRLATAYYEQNRIAMDEGARIAWPERFNHDERSAIQHAMNLKLRNEAAFFAEYQNEPLIEDVRKDDLMTADQVAAKINNIRRGEPPIGCNHVTAFVDVQQKMLYYVVVAWQDDFTGFVIDYGGYPDQNRPYFTLADANVTLASVARGTGLEGAIYAGLDKLTKVLLAREWRRQDGAMLRIERCLVDANWGTSTDVVYQFCRQSPHAAVLMPSHGRFVGASSLPLSQAKRKPGERVGLNWRVPHITRDRAVRHVVYDTNYWKSFVHARLAVAMGDHGCLSLFGAKPERHRLFADHVTAEYYVKTEGRGRTVDEWKLRPDRPDNHWLDGLVGCAVGASMQGCAIREVGAPRTRPRQRMTWAEMRRRRA